MVLEGQLIGLEDKGWQSVQHPLVASSCEVLACCGQDEVLLVIGGRLEQMDEPEERQHQYDRW